VNEKLKHLRQDMSYTERELGRLTGNLEGSIADLRRATNAMTAAYAKLPPDLRNALEGTSSGKTLTRFSTPTSSAEISGSKLVVRDNQGNGWLVLDARISELDADGSNVWNRDGKWSISFLCRKKPNGERNVCVNASDFPNYEYGHDVTCSTKEECEAFLSALRRAAKANR
jgi:hypothetical protein